MEDRKLSQLFLRQVEVIIGPLPEYQGGGPESKGVRLYGDGTSDNLRIKFQINKPWLPSNIQVFNLGPALRNSIHKGVDEAQLLVRAGWSQFGMVDLFRGSLLASFNTRQGADIITELVGFSGWYSKMRAVVAKTFDSGMSIKDIVIALASQFEGITVDPKLVMVSSTVIGEQGDSFAGTVKEKMDRLARVYGFTWFIDMGVFHAISNDQSFLSESLPEISTQNNTLFRAEPMLASPIPKKTGVIVSSLFQPFVQVMRRFSLDSAVNPDLTGTYVAHTIAHSGDTHSDQWGTEIQSWIVSGTATLSDLQLVNWTDIELIAGTIYGEAGGEPHQGKIAVGLTIQNRVRNPGAWGSSWREVIFKKDQFAAWTDLPTQISAARQQKNSIWQECMEIAQGIYVGRPYNNAGLPGKPTNFHSGPKPSWAYKLQSLGSIGRHYFYHDTRID